MKKILLVLGAVILIGCGQEAKVFRGEVIAIERVEVSGLLSRVAYNVAIRSGGTVIVVNKKALFYGAVVGDAVTLSGWDSLTGNWARFEIDKYQAVDE